MARQLGDLRLPSGERFGDLRDQAGLRFMAGCLKTLDPSAMTPPLEQCWLKGYDVLEQARKVQCPVMVLASDETVGGMLPADDAVKLTAALPDGIHIPMKGVTHLAHWHQPELVLKYLLGFLHG
jgi:pimeloyl-ACP methyl ester carboxylesterase